MSSEQRWKNVPEALRLTPRWSTWRYYDRDGRKAKVPAARVDDPLAWGLFEDACTRADVSSVRVHGGIGFLLGESWSGVDMDGVIVNGQLREDAKTFLAEIGGYQEVSPSGTGVKCIGRGDRIGLELNFKNAPLPSLGVTTDSVVTLWTGPRFFTVTGEVIDTSGDPLQDLNLSRWPAKSTSPRIEYERPAWIPRPGTDLRGTENMRPTKTGKDLSDNDLINIARQHEKFALLWAGQITTYGGDHSRADAAMCSLLAYYTGRDPGRIDRLFRQSKLMRPKWETNSYRNSTIRKALALSEAIWEREI